MCNKHWDEKMTTEETNGILKNLANVFIQRINSETERECLAACISSNSILDLCDFVPDYSALSVGDALNIRQVQAFFQKRDDLIVEGVDPTRTAIIKFLETEQLCRETNHIYWLRSEGSFCFLPHVEARLLRAQRKIALMLGDVPDLSDLKLRFGNGGTTQVVKRKAAPSIKLGMPFASSKELVGSISEVLAEMPGWTEWQSSSGKLETCLVRLEIHSGVLDFVPKTFKTKRSIVKEPSINTMCQLGINDFLSARFKKFGLDLTDQEPNRRAALVGSLTGDLATLDLSSASDLNAYRMVMDLVPDEWFSFLCRFRTGTVEYEKHEIRLAKFSTMGNGFTFPLESVIFYALACSCVNEEDLHLVRTFGDDIIVPGYAYEALAELLHVVGHQVNHKKSFSEGPFRESCGADYLRGIDIRPFYVKDSLAIMNLFSMHNFFVRKGDPEVAQLVLEIIPGHFHKFGPDGYGDGHLIGDGGLTPYGRDRGFSGFTFETYTLSAKKDFSTRPGDRIYPFYSTYINEKSSVRPLDQRLSISDLLGQSRRGREAIAQFANDFEPLPAASYSYDKKGQLGVSIPGDEGVNLIKIYTLSSRGS